MAQSESKLNEKSDGNYVITNKQSDNCLVYKQNDDDDEDILYASSNCDDTNALWNIGDLSKITYDNTIIETGFYIIKNAKNKGCLTHANSGADTGPVQDWPGVFCEGSNDQAIWEITKIENIEDDKNNTTRFLIMSKSQQDRNMELEYITSCIFEVKSIPSALYKALGGLATNGINMIKLESFISDRDFNKAQFYLEFEGHSNDAPVKAALDEITHYTNQLNILGVYPKHSFRS